MTTAELNTLWGRLIVEELVRCGVDYFCISPGSRSTPLTAAAARHTKAQNVIHYDERGAAFHALGYARGSGKPAALICTSGTAAANYYPAIIEAASDGVPLIALTADRPPELRNTGANQTINQVGLYANYPRWQLDLTTPEETTDPHDVLKTVDEMVAAATGNHRGPVHLNCPFREPLLCSPEESANLHWPDALADWSNGEKPLLELPANFEEPDHTTVNRLQSLLNNAENGLLIVGRLHNDTDRAAVLSFIEKLGWPTLPDITSGLRCVTSGNIANSYDLALLSDAFAKAVRPDVILHLGGRVVSKRLTETLEAWKPDEYIHIDLSPDRLNPAHCVTEHVTASVTSVCDGLSHVNARPAPDATSKLWRTTSDAMADLVKVAGIRQTFTESHLAWRLSQTVDPDHGLWIASSMPIRDWDMVSCAGVGPLRVAANRGASGIDGTIASATGYAVGLNRPVTLVIGDLALLHDMNSLAFLTCIDQPVTIVLLNNNGGRIFEHLQIAKHKEIFEPYFVAPHGLRDFRAAAAQFNVAYRCVSTISDFDGAFQKAVNSPDSSIIEASVGPLASVQFRKKLRRKIVDAMSPL